METIKNYPVPRDIRELRSFLGLINYCREYIPEYSIKSKPLFDLLKGESKRSIRKILHSKKTILAFRMLREELTEQTTRAQPDFTKEFILITDASEIGMGAILAQKDKNGNERMISAFSKNFDKHQRNHATTDKELLGVVKGIENYRHYLLGKEFTLRTDHKALTHLWECKDPTTRLLRWAMKLQEYKFKVEYIKDEDNAADGYSRINRIRIVESRGEEITEEKKKKILTEYHITLGHGSSNNMKAAMRHRYHWVGMFRDIDEHCNSCLVCTKAGHQEVNTKNKVIEVKTPNELWKVDLVGRLDDRGKNKFIVVCIDHHTKWIETKIINTKSAPEICKTIEQLIIEKHGVPKRILTDCGLEFNNQQITNLANKYGISWEFAYPFHHQTTGAVERVIQTLMNKIKKLCEFGKDRWSKYVEAGTLAVNLSYHRALGTSPFIYYKGRLPELDIDKEMNQPRIWVSKEDSKTKRNIVFKKYKGQIVKGKVNITKRYNIGEPVLIFRPTQNKLDANWHEGYRITKRLTEDAYMVTKGNSEIRVNKRHIRSF